MLDERHGWQRIARGHATPMFIPINIGVPCSGTVYMLTFISCSAAMCWMEGWNRDTIVDGGCRAGAGGAPPKAGGCRSTKKQLACKPSHKQYMHGNFAQKAIIIHYGRK